MHFPLRITWHKQLLWMVMLVLMGSVATAILTGKLLFLLAPLLLLLLVAGIYYPQLLFFLLIFSIPFSAEIQVTVLLGTDIPDEALMWLVSLIVLLMMLFRPPFVSGLFFQHSLTGVLAVHMLWIVVCCIFSYQPLLSLKYFAAKTWYVLPFVLGSFLLLKNKKTIIAAGLLLLAGITMVTAIVFIKHAVAGFSFDKVSEVTLPFFRNHVNYAAMLVCLVPVAVMALVYSEKHKGFLILLVVFMLTALFFSYSRGAWIALLAGLLTAAAVKWKVLKWLGIIVAIITVVVFYNLARNNRYLDYRPDFYKTIYHEEFSQHIQATYKMHDLSTAERFYRWIAAFRMMEGHWFTGYGPNNFYHYYKPHTVTVFRTYVSDNREKSTVHNYFLLLMTEQGLPGVLIFVVLLTAMFAKAQQLYHAITDKFYKSVYLVIASVLGMITVLISLSDLIETDKIGSLFFLCLGLLITMDLMNRNQKVQVSDARLPDGQATAAQ